MDDDHFLQSVSENDDETAFRSLFERYYAALCLFAKRYVEDRTVREDIVQDVFFTIWEKRKLIVPTTSDLHYLTACVKNACLNHLRKQNHIRDYENKVTGQPPEYSNGDENPYLLNELEELLEKTLEKLPPEYRTAFEMNRMEQKGTNEIAENMGVSIRTVERYRKKAIELLKLKLKDYLPLLIMLLYT